jgi:hypothetical protein
MTKSAGAMTRRLTVVLCLAGTLGAAAAVATQAAGETREPAARAAKRVKFNEVAHLKYSHEKGTAIVESGNATGTYNAPLTAEFKLLAKSVSARVTISPHGGTITGTATAKFIAKGELDYFGGEFKFGHGTGKFRHISEIKGKPLGFSGVLNHETDEGEVKTNGEAND